MDWVVRQSGRPVIAAGLILGLAAVGAWGAEPPDAPVKPTGVVRLFNGRDLAGLSTWLKGTGKDDPRGVFRVADGLLHVSGAGHGYVATDRPYRDYHLTVEYRWGKGTDGGDSVRNSGVLLHATGPDGNADGAWMASVECQLAQGCVGDLIAIPGRGDGAAPIPVRLTGDVALGPDKRPRWKEGGAPRVFTGGQLWWSRHDPNFQERRDTRGKDDVESPPGEWNRVECLCEGDRVEVRVNGVTVNKAYGVAPAAGKVLLQSEGFELVVRRFELQPLKPREDTR